MKIVEAFAGEYASGKSENAINRALMLNKLGREVTLVDLDTVEPFYTLRPIKAKLEQQGLSVVAWSPEEVEGLGEAGSVMKPEMRWVLKRTGDIILDIGYGVHGAKIFNLVEGAKTDINLRVYAVINTCRPMTSDANKIIDYLRDFGRVDGIVHNTHLGKWTDINTVLQGKKQIDIVANKLNIPIISTSVEKNLAGKLQQTEIDHEIWPIEKYMDVNSMW